MKTRILACVTAVSIGQCGPTMMTPAEQSLMAVHRVFHGVRSYQDSVGTLPSNLMEVCELNPDWCLLDSDWWRLDGWDQLLIYSAGDTGFEVRSIGPDRQANTPDDLSLSSHEERALLQKLLGCYDLPSKVWNRIGKQLVLHDEMVQGGEYRLAPQGSYQRVVWYPLPEARVWAIWSTPPGGLRLQVRLDGDTLTGTLYEYSDFAGGRNTDIVAGRGACSG